MLRAPTLALLLVAGCATDEGSRKDLTRLNRQIEDLRRQTDGDRHALHELENRIFILEDKLETSEVAREKTPAVPRLPVITKAPEPEPAAVAEPPVEDEPVDDGRPSFVIRMDGRGQAARVERRPIERSSSEPADIAAIDEKLPVTAMPKRPEAPEADAMAEYQRAYAALGRHEHAAAIAGLRAFIARYPSHDYADNAQYWLGEAYYDQADYRTALVEFRAVLKRYPAGNKAPDALLKVGFCLAKLGDGGASNDVLAQVVEIYPRTDAARLATQRLDEMRRVSR